MSRVGKPIRPLIELQKNGSIINILTTTVQDGNVITDKYKSEAWEVQPKSVASAIYIDGIFKGMGFFAGEEGAILNVEKDINLKGIVIGDDGKQKFDVNGDPVLQPITFAAKGILGKLLDAALIERGSALKPSMMQTLIYCLLTGIAMFMAGMMYG